MLLFRTIQSRTFINNDGNIIFYCKDVLTGAPDGPGGPRGPIGPCKNKCIFILICLVFIDRQNILRQNFKIIKNESVLLSEMTRLLYLYCFSLLWLLNSVIFASTKALLSLG